MGAVTGVSFSAFFVSSRVSAPSVATEPLPKGSAKPSTLCLESLSLKERDCKLVTEGYLADLISKLFPSYVEELPPDWESVAAKFPKDEALVEFEKAIEQMVSQCTPYSALAPKLSPNPSLDSILEVLLQENPLFAKAWELANKKEKVTLVEFSNDSFLGPNGEKVFSLNRGAKYLPTDHEIHINRHADLFAKMRSLIFETINALQRKSCFRITEFTKAGKLNREEYALVLELIEQNSYAWRHRIFAEMKVEAEKNPCYGTFSLFWKRANTPREKGLISHTDNYRRRWDARHAENFFAKRGWIICKV